MTAPGLCPGRRPSAARAPARYGRSHAARPRAPRALGSKRPEARQRQTKTPVRHIGTAVIHLEGPHAIRINGEHNRERFHVDTVSAREYVQIAHVKPHKAAAVYMDIYANAILQAHGL